jgi:hypothetical protein
MLNDPIGYAPEASYWVDIDLRRNNGRGYWFNLADRKPDVLPYSYEIRNACFKLRREYEGNKLYVIYHRQFEVTDAMNIFKMWKLYAARYGMTVVPAIVLETYATPPIMNFSTNEIASLAVWCTQNINQNEFAIYDVYVRQGIGSEQDTQLSLIRKKIGNKLVRIGLQPGEKLNPCFNNGVEDIWNAECQGLTNKLWQNPVDYKGTNIYGRKLLQKYVDDRIHGEKRRITWNLIPVAWDYHKPVDPYGYICPGDNALTNDPPIPGRLKICTSYIEKCYKEAANYRIFGGYSCDLHILAANSYGKPEKPSFYEQLKANKPYIGYFSGAMKEIAGIYHRFQ